MIALLKGKIIKLDPTYIILDVSGIGYEVKISLRTYSEIKDLKEIKINTHLQVKDDSHTLYGFFSISEKIIFLDLISINGVGPSTAMMILSSLSASELQEAILNGDLQTIKSIKGIGMKTAERIILEGFERLTAKWRLLRDEISLNVRGEFLENESGDEPPSDAAEVQEVDNIALSKDFDIQRYIQNRLSDLVEEEIEGAQEILTEREQNNFEHMVYGFVALVDELLLVSVRWDQSDEENKRLQRRWLDFLLEKRIFGTRNAGLTLFERISFITQKKALTEMDKQLCAVYLHILGIGFGQNKLSKQLELGFYRRQLLSCIPGWSKDLRRPIFDDQPYLVQLSQDSESKRLAPLSKWRRRFLYFLAGYVAVTGISALYLYNWLMTSLGLLR